MIKSACKVLQQSIDCQMKKRFYDTHSNQLPKTKVMKSKSKNNKAKAKMKIKIKLEMGMNELHLKSTPLNQRSIKRTHASNYLVQLLGHTDLHKHSRSYILYRHMYIIYIYVVANVFICKYI